MLRGGCGGARHLQEALLPRGSALAAASRLPGSSRAAVPGVGGDAGGGRERVQPLGKEPEPSRIWKRPQLGVCWRELSVFRPREEMWRGVLPCPHCLPSCLTPPPLPDPDRASQTLCSRGWELLGGGFPGEEVPTALLEEEGTLASPPPRLPQPSPPSPTPPFSVPVPPGPPGVPKFPLPGLHRRFTGLPSHFSATPRSPRRGWERQSSMLNDHLLRDF